MAKKKAPLSASINAVEVVLILALFCRGAEADQLRFCFNIFDLDGGGSIDQEEMTNFMRTLMMAAYKVRLIPERIPDAEFPTAAENMFHIADADGGGDVDADEFINWARTHVVGRQLLHAFKKKKKKSHRQAGHTQVQRSEEEARQAKEVQRRLQAKMKSANAGRKLLRQLSRDSGFKVEELQRLRGLFLETCDPETRSINKHDFVDLMSREFPILAMGSAAMRLFDAFDADGSGSIDFKEFTLGLSSLTTGDSADKLDVMFQVFDSSGDGSLELNELVNFVKQGSDDMIEAAAFAGEMINTLDANGDGNISKEEFKQMMAQNPLLQHCFKQTFNANLGGDEGVLLKQGNKDFDLQRLRKIWQTYSSEVESEQGAAMNLQQFRSFMVDEFGTNPDMLPMVNSVFKRFDVDKSGFISMQELFNGLSQIMDGNVEDKSAFFFNLYDLDGGGDIDSDEVMTMLLSSKSAADATGDDAAAMIKALDKNGDGVITMEEFKVRKHNNVHQ